MPNYGSQVRKVRTRVSGYLKRTVLVRASWIDDAQMNLQRLWLNAAQKLQHEWGMDPWSPTPSRDTVDNRWLIEEG